MSKQEEYRKAYVYPEDDSGSLCLILTPNGRVRVSVYLAAHSREGYLEVDGQELEDAISSLGAWN